MHDFDDETGETAPDGLFNKPSPASGVSAWLDAYNRSASDFNIGNTGNTGSTPHAPRTARQPAAGGYPIPDKLPGSAARTPNPPAGSTPLDNRYPWEKQAATPAPRPDFRDALKTADGHQFTLADAENRSNFRYDPVKIANFHENYAVAAKEGMQPIDYRQATVDFTDLYEKQASVAREGREIPDYRQAGIDPATKSVLSEHFLEGNQRALEDLYPEIARHPGGLFPAIAITGALQGGMETAKNITQGISNALHNDVQHMAIDPANATALPDRHAPRQKMVNSDATVKAFDETMQYLLNHPDFRNENGGWTRLGNIARLTGNVSRAAPGTALSMLGGPAVRALVLYSSNEAIEKSAYAQKREELNNMELPAILRDPAHHARYQRFIAEGNSAKNDARFRDDLARAHARNVANIHGILTVGGCVLTHHSSAAANTLFAQYMRGLSLSTLTSMAPPELVRRAEEWRRRDLERKNPKRNDGAK